MNDEIVIRYLANKSGANFEKLAGGGGELTFTENFDYELFAKLVIEAYKNGELS